MTQTMSAPVGAGGPAPHDLQMPADGDGADARSQTAQFITFKVGEEEYGMVALLALQRLFDLQEHGNAPAGGKTALD